MAHSLLQLEEQPHHIIQPIIDEDVPVLAGVILILADHSDRDAQLNVAHLHILRIQDPHSTHNVVKCDPTDCRLAPDSLPVPYCQTS